jgi:hypothetical protein
MILVFLTSCENATYFIDIKDVIAVGLFALLILIIISFCLVNWIDDKIKKFLKNK